MSLEEILPSLIRLRPIPPTTYRMPFFDCNVRLQPRYSGLFANLSPCVTGSSSSSQAPASPAYPVERSSVTSPTSRQFQLPRSSIQSRAHRPPVDLPSVTSPSSHQSSAPSSSFQSRGPRPPTRLLHGPGVTLCEGVRGGAVREE